MVNFLNAGSGAISQLCDFIRHNCKASARITGTGSFYGSVKGKKINLLGDVIDDIHNPHNLAGAVLLVILYGMITVLIESALKPKLVGDRAKMHILLVFLSIIGGLNAFGFLGIIYGPLIVTAFLTLAEIYLTNYDKYVKHAPAE